MPVYESLAKIFYKFPDQHQKIYRQRFDSPTSKHFDFHIKQFNRKKVFPAFLCYSEELTLLVEKIYKKSESLSQLLKSVPPVVLRQFALASVVDEVNAGNAIEGVHSTRRELADVLQGVSDKPRFSSILQRYSDLISGTYYDFKSCSDLRNFYDNFAHSEVIRDNPKYKLDGKIFRREPVDITSPTNKILHRGLYPEEKIISEMQKALQILNDDCIPLLVRVSVFHYFFEYIHPFYDGNGRTARFIVSYFLALHFHFLPALRLSLTIKNQRKKYYDLFTVTDSEFNCGELTFFVQGFIEIISDTFDEIESILNRKMIQLIKYQNLLNFRDPLTNLICSILLQASSFIGTGVSMEELMALTGKSRNTVKSRLKNLPSNYVIKSGVKKIFFKLNPFIFR